MVAAAAGMLAGGLLVGTTPNIERTVAVSLLLAGALLVVLAMGAVPPSFAMVLVAMAGFCSGVSAPSRDMLIRRVTPKGATGTVYGRSEEHTSELQSLMRISYAVFCLKKKKHRNTITNTYI